MIPIYKTKTFWTAVAGIVTAVGGYLAGELGAMATIGACLAGLSIIFTRQGIEKSGPNGVPPLQERGETLK